MQIQIISQGVNMTTCQKKDITDKEKEAGKRWKITQRKTTTKITSGS